MKPLPRSLLTTAILFGSVSAWAVTYEIALFEHDGQPAALEGYTAVSSDGRILGSGIASRDGRIELGVQADCDNVTFVFPNSTGNGQLKLSGKFNHTTSFYFPDPGLQTASTSAVPGLENFEFLFDTLDENYKNKLIPAETLAVLRLPQYKERIQKLTEPLESDSITVKEGKLAAREELMSNMDRLSKGWQLGIKYQGVDTGILVTSVIDGSPADKHGIKSEDLITQVKIGDQAFSLDTAGASLNEILRSATDGEIVIEYERDGEHSFVPAHLVQRSTPDLWQRAINGDAANATDTNGEMQQTPQTRTVRDGPE